jgi:FMN phosphatase YigB (HAD superfamily)
MYALKTVDVWDTLLRRRCHPETIKAATAQHVWLKYHHQIKPSLQQLQLIYEARLKCELELAQAAKRQGYDDEYHIESVIFHWLNKVLSADCIRQLGISFLFSESKALANLELEIEVKNTFPDPHIEETIQKYPAQNIAYLSDFYMDSKRIDTLLNHHNLGKKIPLGIVSCDVKKNKRSGNLFKYAQERFSIKADQHVHIGDNSHSDFAVPQTLGIKAILFSPQPKSQPSATDQHNPPFVNRLKLFSKIEREALDLARTQFKPLNASQKNLIDLGVKTAPLFIGFMIFCAEQAIIERLAKIFFLTREGEFFAKVFAELFPDRMHAGLTLPQTGILEVSRLATFGPTIDPSQLLKSFSRIWRAHRCQNISGIFESIGLNSNDFSDLLSKLGLAKDELVLTPDQDSRILNLFSDTNFLRQSKDSINKKAELLIDYLKSKDIPKLNKIGVVDIGWSGSIQDNLKIIWEHAEWHGFYLATTKDKQQTASASNTQSLLHSDSKKGYLFDRSIPNRPFLSGMPILELLSCSDQGSVTGYQISDDRILPIRTTEQTEDNFYCTVGLPFQKGVILAASVWREYVRREIITSPELIQLGRKSWQQIVQSPSPELVHGFLNTAQHDQFIFGDYIQRKNIPSARSYIRALFDPSLRGKIKTFIKRFQWPEALPFLSNSPILARKLLSLAFTIQNAIQSLKFK